MKFLVPRMQMDQYAFRFWWNNLTLIADIRLFIGNSRDEIEEMLKDTHIVKPSNESLSQYFNSLLIIVLDLKNLMILAEKNKILKFVEETSKKGSFYVYKIGTVFKKLMSHENEQINEVEEPFQEWEKLK